jgi:hypothetical protein
MSYGKCERCGDPLAWLPSHTCKPVFLVWYPDNGETEEDASEFREYDAEAAAEAWADDYERRCAEYRIAAGESTVEVMVKASDGAVTRWSVSGECVPQYYARAVRP